MKRWQNSSAQRNGGIAAGGLPISDRNRFQQTALIIYNSDMTDGERQDLRSTVTETHASLSEVAFKLRLELPQKSATLKTAIKAERVAFHLKRALQQLVIEDVEQANERERLPKVLRGGQVVDVKRQLRPTARYDAP